MISMTFGRIFDILTESATCSQQTQMHFNMHMCHTQMHETRLSKLLILYLFILLKLQKIIQQRYKEEFYFEPASVQFQTLVVRQNIIKF